MNQPIAPGLIPPRPGLEREEPELTLEDDIPPDDRAAIPPDDGTVLPPEGLPADSDERPLRQVERE